MKIALLFLALSTAAFAQPNTCGGLTSVTDGAKPVYPPLARYARVNGMVILLVSFKTTGEADAVQIVSGPPMLRQSATDYVKSWRANEYTGPRSCAVVITFNLDRGDGAPDSVIRGDLQHVDVNSYAPCLCDPSGELKRKRRFLFF